MTILSVLGRLAIGILVLSICGGIIALMAWGGVYSLLVMITLFLLVCAWGIGDSIVSQYKDEKEVIDNGISK